MKKATKQSRATRRRKERQESAWAALVKKHPEFAGRKFRHLTARAKQALAEGHLT